MSRLRRWCPLAAIVALAGLLGTGTAQAAKPVPATTSCPSRVPGVVKSRWTATGTSLLPTGARSLLLCSYKTKVVKNAAAVTRRLVPDGRTLTAVAAGFRELPATPPLPPPGAIAGSDTSCPGAFQPSIVVFANYRRHAPVRLWIDEARCRMVTNGRLYRYFTVDSPLIMELNRLIAGGS